MRYEWDEAKRRSNLEKHGIDFADVPTMFDGLVINLLDERFDYGEHRFISLGVLGRVVIVVAHTETDEVIRLISARKATRNEEESYLRAVRDELGETPSND